MDKDINNNQLPRNLSITKTCELIPNLIPDILAQVNENKIYVWLNKAGIEFYGQDAIGREASYYFEGEQDTYKEVQHILEGNKDTIYLESWQRRLDGEKRLLAWWCTSLKDEHGKIVGALSTGRDITEQFKNEEKIRYSEKQLKNALAIAHLGPWEYDFIKDEFTFNDTFYSLFGITADQVGGYKLSSADYAKRFVYPEDIQLVAQEVKKASETSDPNYSTEIRHRIVYSNGEVRYVDVRFFIVKDESGKTIKSFGINQDITNSQNEELKLTKMLDETKRMNDLMINRELKMIELKKEIEELRNKVAAK